MLKNDAYGVLCKLNSDKVYMIMLIETFWFLS